MAIITGYSTLQTAVEDYLARSDLTTWTPNFVQNAESKIYKRLRTRSMETALSVNIASGVAAVPADYLELKYAYINGSPIQWLDSTTPEEVYRSYPTRSASGKPTLIAREAGNFIFGPFPDDTYTVKGIYYAKPADLRTSTVNALIQDHPDLFLYGALLEAEPFLKNDNRITVWKSFHDDAWAAVKESERRENISGGSLRVRPG
jgi:hypothetical protein